MELSRLVPSSSILAFDEVSATTSRHNRVAGHPVPLTSSLSDRALGLWIMLSSRGSLMSQSWKFPTSRCNTLPSNKCDFLYRNARLASPLDSSLIQYAFYLRDIRFKVLTVQLLHPVGLPSGSPRSLELAVALLDLVHRHPRTSIFSHDTEVQPLIPGIKLRSIFLTKRADVSRAQSFFGDRWASSTHLYVLRSVRGSNPSRTRLSLKGPSTMTYATAGRYTCFLSSRRTDASSVHQPHL
jgi:hypothetical protein